MGLAAGCRAARGCCCACRARRGFLRASRIVRDALSTAASEASRGARRRVRLRRAPPPPGRLRRAVPRPGVATGRRRGGVAGVSTGTAAAAKRARGRRPAEPEAALARGMVLGQDEQIDESTRQDWRDSRPRPPACERTERDAAGGARGPAARARPGGTAPRRCPARARRALRAARRRRPVAPAGGGHGRRRESRR